MRRVSGKLYVTTGASQSGKTTITRQATAAAPRLSVWDPKGQYAREDQCERVTDKRKLLSLMRNCTGPLRLAFVSPNPADFDFWAQASFWWSRLKPCTVIAEEIANVTSPAKAPIGWHLLLSQGLEFGTDIHAITQRISESDKTCVGNASIVRSFLLPFPSDRKYIANVLDISVDQVAALAELEYFERDMRRGAAVKKKLNFARNRAPKVADPIK